MNGKIETFFSSSLSGVSSGATFCAASGASFMVSSRVDFGVAAITVTFAARLSRMFLTERTIVLKSRMSFVL